MLQWEWLGGLPPLRRAAVVGAGSWGTSLAVDARPRAASRSSSAAARAEQAARSAPPRATSATCPACELPDGVAVRARRRARPRPRRPRRASPSPPATLPAALAEHGAAMPDAGRRARRGQGRRARRSARCPPRTSRERVRARAVASLGGPAHAADALAHGASLVRRLADAAFAASSPTSCAPPASTCHRTTDVAGVELAGARQERRRAGRGRRRARAGPNAAGAAAGKVFAEVEAFARAAGRAARDLRRPGRRRRPRRHGRWPSRAATAAPASCSAPACPRAEIAPALGHAAEAVDTVPLLADAMRRAGVEAPAVDGLAALIEGRVEPDRWARTRDRAAAAPARRQGRLGNWSTRGSGPDVDDERKVQLDKDFSDLYRAHLRDVYSYAYYRVGNHHDAEDLTEQTFLQAYRHFERAQRESDGRPAAPVAHPHRPQPGGELLPRPLAQAADARSTTPAVIARRTTPRSSSRVATSCSESSRACRSCPTTAARR